MHGQSFDDNNSMCIRIIILCIINCELQCCEDCSDNSGSCDNSQSIAASAVCSEPVTPNDGQCSCSCSDGFDQYKGPQGLLCQSEPHLYKVPKQVMT